MFLHSPMGCGHFETRTSQHREGYGMTVWQ
jgi:hypothetical protein